MAILGPRSRAALAKFHDHDLVEDVRVAHDRIRVAYVTGVVETWGLEGDKPRRLTFPTNGWWRHRPREVPQYDQFRSFAAMHDEAVDPFFMIPRSEIRKAGFLDRRLLVQVVVDRLLREGWRRPTYPQGALNEDLTRLVADDQRFALSPGYLRGQPRRPFAPPPGFVLANHLVDWGSLRSPGRSTLEEAWRDSRRLYWAVSGIIERRHHITRTAVIHRLTCGHSEGFARRAGPKWSSPSLWRSIFVDLLGLRRPVVLDLDPGCGSRAVAVASLGGVYLSSSRSWIEEGLDWAASQGALLAEDDGCTADVGILGDFRDRSVEELVHVVEQIRRRCSSVVATARGENRDRLREALPDADLVRFRPRPFSRADDLFVVVHQVP